MKLLSGLRSRMVAPLCFGVIAFFASSLSMLQYQQRIADSTDETRKSVVPQVQDNFRFVRNLETLRHYGNLAQKAADPDLRRDAAHLAMLVAAIPPSAHHQEVRALLDEALQQIIAMLDGQRPSKDWAQTDWALAKTCDRLASEADALITGRVEHIGTDAVRLRNMALVQSILFGLGVCFVLWWNRQLLTRMRIKHDFFRQLSFDFRKRIHALQLSLMTPGQARLENAHTEIGRTIDAMSDLQRHFDNFLDVTQLETHGIGMAASHVDLPALLHTLVRQFEDTAAKRQVQLRVRTSPHFHLQSDRLWLTRVLENILAAALQLAHRKVLLVASTRADGGQRILITSDGHPWTTGTPGASRLFLAEPQDKPAQHAGATVPAIIQPHHTHHLSSELQLGLSVTQRIAKLMGITIEIRPRVSGDGVVVQLDFDPHAVLAN